MLYHNIRKALTTLNESSFEHLCDELFPQWRPEYKNFHPNTVIGANKTRKGKPDAFSILSDGSYVFLEYTTVNKSNLSKKLKKDLEECIVKIKAHFSGCRISKIVLCCNGSISAELSSELISVAADNGYLIELIANHNLAMALQKYHPLLSRFLNINLPHSQFTTITEFLKLNNNKKFTTPLDNTFLGRDEEISHIISELKRADILIIYGKTGIGKTRLAIEAIEKEYGNDPGTEVFCVKFKGSCELKQELLNVWDREKNLVLLIDDANYVKDGLLPVAELQNETLGGKIKLVLTLRNYVYQDTKTELGEFNFTEIEVKPLSRKINEEILQPYKLEFSAVDRILDLTKNNTRLAIMLADLARRENKWSTLINVSDVYGNYMEKVMKDSALKKPDAKKVVALIWLFRGITINDLTLHEKIESAFGIKPEKLWKIINQLHDKEIIDVYNNVAARVPEQVLGTYLFYNVFISEQQLSLRTLYETFYDSNKSFIFSRIKDSIETFDYKKVLDVLKPILESVIEKNQNNEQELALLYHDYWFVFPTKVLAFAKSQIEIVPYKENPIYYTEKKKDHLSNRDKILQLLAQYVAQATPEIETALELLLDYCKRKPEFTNELTDFLKETIGYDFDDYRNSYKKQSATINILMDGMAPDNHCEEIWFKIAPLLLTTEFRHSTMKDENTIGSYRYKPAIDDKVGNIRALILKTLYELFDRKEEKSFMFLYEYFEHRSTTSNDAYKFDIPFLIPIIKDKLTHTNLLHCRWVDDFYRYTKQNKIYDLTAERTRFLTETFNTIQILDYCKLEGIDDFRLKPSKMENLDLLKKKEIQKNIPITNLEQFGSTYKIIHQGLVNGLLKNYYTANMMDALLENILSNDFAFYVKILNHIVKNDNSIGYVPRFSFTDDHDGKDKFDKLFGLLSKVEFRTKTFWMSTLLESSHDSFLTSNHLESYKGLLSGSDSGSFFINNNFLARAEKLKPGYIIELTESHNEQYKYGSAKAHFGPGFIKRFIHLFEENYDKLIKLYFIQETEYQHNDHDGEDFLIITDKHRSFPFEYLEWDKKNNENRYFRPNEDFEFLGRLWELDDIEPTIEKLLEYFTMNIDRQVFEIHPANALFKNRKVDEEIFLQKSQQVLFNFINHHHRELDMMKPILDICIHTLPSLYPAILTKYLTINRSIEDFKKVDWQRRFGVVSGDVIWGDMETKEWETLLDILKAMKPKSEYLEHIDYIEEKMNRSKKRAGDERVDQFLKR